MKSIMNERGYTLLLVLLTIVLIMIFAPLLFSKTLNTALQIGKTESMTQAKDIAEMGIQYSVALIESEIAMAIKEAKADPNIKTVNNDRIFCEKIRNRLQSTSLPKQFSFESNSSYTYDIDYNAPIIINSKTTTNTNNCTDFKNMLIEIRSTGITENISKSVKDVVVTFNIENKGSYQTGNEPVENGGIPVDPNDLPLQKYTTNVSLSGNSRSQLFSSVHFTRPVVIGGNGVLMIGGNAFFESDLTFNGSNGLLTVSGDAYFKSPINFNGSGTNVCVRGTPYLNVNGSWKPYSYLIENNNLLCPPALQYEYHYDINEWGILDGSINVIY
ncbi:hypothetical protein [Bacillus sp. FJAT-45350]|uniref:hypothetical protein n=1 Tax=Bacillus sp. FJAT-45350 TaxID=2011014 RepID=UPI000BB8036A|nr:hypothetical protein [Bacillus sp. FJAT-45350]